MPSTRTSAIAVAAAVALLFGAAPAGATSPSASTQHEPRTASPAGADKALDRALRDLVAMPGGPPGVIAVVQRGHHREVHTFGVANVRTGRKMTVHDRMRIASTAKAFSGAAALALVSKGRLSLRDTIGEVLPGLPAAWSAVTLKQLLNHTSGVPDFSKSPDFVDALLASLTKAPRPRKLLTYVADEPLRFDPGTRYAYSNSDNVIVALMVQAVTGASYEGQLFEQVYQPLGLRTRPCRGGRTSGVRSSTDTTTTRRPSLPRT